MGDKVEAGRERTRVVQEDADADGEAKRKTDGGEGTHVG